MTDRVYPSAKLNPPPARTVVNGGAQAGGPAKTTQLYNPNRSRPVYRPPQNQRTRSCSGRKCCCLCFLYTLITLLIVILLAAIAACIFYVLYHPKHPTFSVTSVRTTRFNLTQPDSTGFAHLNSRFDLTLTAKNPNKKKISFLYDPMTLTLATSGVNAGNATLPAFTHVAGNTTVLHVTVSSDPTNDLDTESVGPLKTDLKKKSGFSVSFQLNTMVEVQMGKLKTRKVGVRVTCDGVKGFQPSKNVKSKVGVVGNIKSSKCKVDLRIKIWKFTF